MPVRVLLIIILYKKKLIHAYTIENISFEISQCTNEWIVYYILQNLCLDRDQRLNKNTPKISLPLNNRFNNLSILEQSTKFLIHVLHTILITLKYL